MKRLMILLFVMAVGLSLASTGRAASKALNVWEYPLDSGCLNTMLVNDSRVVRVTAEQEYDDIVPCPPEPAVVVAVKPVPTPVVPAAPVVVQEKKEPRVFIVHFDFDKSNIKASEQSVIDGAAAYIQEGLKATVVIAEGNCDVRGTDKYNMALGMKRAISVKDALIDKGIDPSIIKVVSKGKSNAIYKLHWQNRRVEILIK